MQYFSSRIIEYLDKISITTVEVIFNKISFIFITSYRSVVIYDDDIISQKKFLEDAIVVSRFST